MSNNNRATYADVLAAPEHVVAEILDGELITSPRPRVRHARAAGVLFNALYTARDGGEGSAGGWWILLEPELHLGADVVVPDLAGWRRQRLQHLPDAAWVSLAPDWVCEVLSPSTSAIDRNRKLPIYARAGVAHAWLLDPIAGTTEVLRRERKEWVSAGKFPGGDPLQLNPFGAQ